MKKSQILHGYGSFRAVFSEGRRIEARVLRGVCRMKADPVARCVAGISIRSRPWNAVQRNRMKRRIRVSLDRELPALERAVQGRGVVLELVITGRPLHDTASGEYPFHQIHADVATIVGEVVNRVCRDWPQHSSV